ncbi:MAG: alpha/beta hydrolase, partial [Thermodesulfobacteriota bacterium]|nr:alpha/beta hydrolase [Thermodesulfobacteriota bacterium]
MPSVTVNGIKIHYQQQGAGPDVVLIHGMGGNMSFWHANTALVSLMKEFRITVYDLRGHGYSSFVKEGYTSFDMAHDLNGLMEEIGLKKAYLVGHSFGGLIALHTASLFPEMVSGLILTEGNIPVLNHLIDLDKWEYRKDREKRLMEIDPKLPKYLDGFNMFLLEYRLRNATSDKQFPIDNFGMRKGLKRIAKRVLKLLDETTAKKDMRTVAGLTEEKLRQVYQPTLALYGQFSPLMVICRYLVDNLPNCKLVEVSEAG